MSTSTQTSAVVELDPHCFACGRHTDHFGEHDGLVAAGLAIYDSNTGDVHRTRYWDDALARRVQDAEYDLVYGADQSAEVLAIREAIEAAIDENYAKHGADLANADWSKGDKLFKQGLSLLLGEGVTHLGQRELFRRGEQAKMQDRLIQRGAARPTYDVVPYL